MSVPLASVLVVGSEALYREALCDVLGSHAEFAVVGQAASFAEAVQVAVSADPELAVVEAGVRSAGGKPLCAALKDVCSARVLVVGDGGDQAELLAAVEAGADGFASRDVGLQRLFSALQRVRDGEAVVPPAMLGALLRDLIVRNRQVDSGRELLTRLTRREKEVLELLVDGCDHEAVADILVISPQTARTHIQNVISKLGVHSRLEAVSLAVRHGLVDRLDRKSA